MPLFGKSSKEKAAQPAPPVHPDSRPEGIEALHDQDRGVDVEPAGLPPRAAGAGTTGLAPGQQRGYQGVNPQGADVDRGYAPAERESARSGRIVGSESQVQHGSADRHTAQAGIIPSGGVGADQRTTGYGETGQHTARGKVESTMGTALGSQSLRQKGEEKQREADIVKAQSAEIGEAERLERAARQHRERAVQGGGGGHLAGGGI